VRVRATFTDTDSNAAIDPGSVDFTVYSPSGSVTPVTPTRDDLGKWSIMFVAAAGGIYTVATTTTDPVAACQRRIVVNPIPL
jgi:hypothetical protein